MATKPIPVKMTDQVHYDLRLMAAASDMTMGDLIGTLVKSLRNRLERYRKKYDVGESYTRLDARMIDLILKRDLGQITMREFNRKMQEIKEADSE